MNEKNSYNEKSSYIVAITGASGAIYGFNLLKELCSRLFFVYLIISKPAFKVIKDEINIFTDLDTDEWAGITKINGDKIGDKIMDEISYKFNLDKGMFTYFDETLIEAKISSGSAKNINGMAVVPCSMGSLSRIACGNSGNLIERAADVMLKERKRLILSPRETPLNDIHLRNMLSLSYSGAIILPPVPAFYNKPATIEDMINFVTGKILDSFGITNELFKRWESYERF